MMARQGSIVGYHRSKSSRRTSMSKVRLHHKKTESAGKVTDVDDGVVAVVDEALEKAVDMTVTGEFKRKQDVKLLSEQTAKELVSRMLENARLPVPPPPEEGGDGREGDDCKVRFAYLQDAEDDHEDFSAEAEEEGEEEEEEEEEEAEEEKVAEVVPSKKRDVVPTSSDLLRRMEKLKDEEVVIKITNLLLQRKIAQINAARKDTANLPDSIRKLKSLKKAEEEDPKDSYRQALEQYGLLKETLQRETRRCELDLSQRRAYRRSLEQQVESERQTVMAGLKRCANLLPLKSTGAAMSDEEVQELLALINRKFLTIQTEHQRFVKTSKRLRDVQAQVKTLEVFGERKQLLYYEQLVEEYQKLKERIEERDDMIGALKMRAISELQEAAHMRDMIQGTEEDIDGLVRKLAAVDDRLEWSRDAVAKAKRKRDFIRKSTKQVIKELDLLAFPHLLQHFQELLKTTEQAKTYLSYLVKVHLEQEASIRKYRRALLRTSRRYNEKIPDKVLYSLKQRVSISRVAETCITDNDPSTSDFHSELRFRVSIYN